MSSANTSTVLLEASSLVRPSSRGLRDGQPATAACARALPSAAHNLLYTYLECLELARAHALLNVLVGLQDAVAVHLGLRARQRSRSPCAAVRSNTYLHPARSGCFAQLLDWLQLARRDRRGTHNGCRGRWGKVCARGEAAIVTHLHKFIPPDARTSIRLGPINTIYHHGLPSLASAVPRNAASSHVCCSSKGCRVTNAMSTHRLNGTFSYSERERGATERRCGRPVPQMDNLKARAHTSLEQSLPSPGHPGYVPATSRRKPSQ